MRSLAEILNANSPSSIVLGRAIKNGDYDAIDLLTCGSGHEVTDEELDYYLKHDSFDGLFWAAGE